MDNTSLKEKGIHGLKWSFIDNFANSGITFIVGIVLARILSPTEFGIIGIITIFISISNAIIDGGFTTALLRKKETTKEDYNTAFYSNLAISVFLFILFILLSGVIANFFNEPILRKIVPAMSVLLIINAISLIQRTIYTKKIDFKTQAKVSLIASLGSGFLGVLSALLSLGVWSLVIQQISRQVLLSFFLWAYSEWRPSLVFSKESFRDLFGFGIKILGANVLNTFFRNIFTFIIGKIYSTEQLGQYTRAEQFNAIFTNNFTAILQRVSFPMLSSIQDEPKRVTYMFRKSIIYSSIITFSAVLFLAAVAKPLIFLMIGEKWSNAVTYLQIMSLYAILYPLQNLNLNMLNIAGRSDIILNLEFVKKIVFIPVFIVGVYFNIKAMLWTTVIYYYLEFLLNTYYIERYFHYGVYKQVKDLIPILVISFSVSIIVWGINLFEISNVLSLTLQVLTGCLLYFFVFRLIPISEYRELKIIIKKEINKLAKI